MKLSELVSNSNNKIDGRFLFAIWIVVILSVTLLLRNPLPSKMSDLRLFWGIRELLNGNEHGRFVIIQYIGNICFFVPYGFLFPWKNKKWLPIITGCILSVAIEVTQYVTILGMCELDDMIANTLGAYIGCIIADKINSNRTKS